MPGYSGTGPAGLGPMTGRGLGPCNPYFSGGMYPGYGGYPGYGSYPLSPGDPHLQAYGRPRWGMRFGGRGFGPGRGLGSRY